jgi:hypothetical protein
VLFWIVLGQTEMLRAFQALDSHSTTRSEAVRKTKLRAAAQHTTRALCYLEQVAAEHVELARAEQRLHLRLLQADLDLGELHRQARSEARELGLPRPSRFERFLHRMFGPLDLWPGQREGVQLRMPLFADLPQAPAVPIRQASPGASA